MSEKNQRKKKKFFFWFFSEFHFATTRQNAYNMNKHIYKPRGNIVKKTTTEADRLLERLVQKEPDLHVWASTFLKKRTIVAHNEGFESPCRLLTTSPVSGGGSKGGNGDIVLQKATAGRNNEYVQVNIVTPGGTKSRVLAHHLAVLAANRPLAKTGEEYHHRCFHPDCCESTHIVVVPATYNLMLNSCGINNKTCCDQPAIKHFFNVHTDCSCLLNHGTEGTKVIKD